MLLNLQMSGLRPIKALEGHRSWQVSYAESFECSLSLSASELACRACHENFFSSSEYTWLSRPHPRVLHWVCWSLCCAFPSCQLFPFLVPAFEPWADTRSTCDSARLLQRYKGRIPPWMLSCKFYSHLRHCEETECKHQRAIRNWWTVFGTVLRGSDLHCLWLGGHLSSQGLALEEPVAIFGSSSWRRDLEWFT